MKILTPTPKLYQGAVFDLDGTLLNTIEDLTDSINTALAKMGFPAHRSAQVMQMVGNGFRLLVERALPENARTEENISEGLRLFDEAYATRYANKTAPYAGISAVLKTLAKRGVGLGVNSNKRNDYTRTLIARAFPDVAFTCVSGERESDGIPKKPHPAAALAMAARMGLAPADVLFIGDSRTDMETGRHAGMDCAGVTWGFRTPDELIANGAVYLIERPEELLQLF